MNLLFTINYLKNLYLNLVMCIFKKNQMIVITSNKLILITYYNKFDKKLINNRFLK